jgi:glycosyltransferase involved in cell wall biosynthesis
MIEKRVLRHEQPELVDLDVAVVIPCFQVENHVRDVVMGIPSFVRTIIAVDDKSQDQTASVLDELLQIEPRLVVIHHQSNLGVGGAVLSGYERAIQENADVIVKMDGDGQMDPSYVLPLITPILLGQADYVKGNRFYFLDYARTMPWARKIGNLGLSFLIKAASGYWNIFDPTNGYTAISADVASVLRSENVEKRFLFESSMLVELYALQARVEQVPMPARYCGEESSLSIRRSLVEFPIYLLRAFLSRIVRRYFVQDFTAVSMFLIAGVACGLFGTVFGVYHWFRSVNTGMPATAGTVMLAAVPIILSFQLLLQAAVLDISSVPSKPPYVRRHRRRSKNGFE